MATIGIDYTAAVHQSAGIGRYTRELVKALAGQAAPGFDPTYRLFVAAGIRGAAVLPEPGFSWHASRLSKRWLERLWYRLRLPIPLETWTGRLDLLHQPDFVLPPVRPQTRTILTVHDLSFVREPDSVMTGMTRLLNRWVPHSVARANHVIAVSEATRQDLIELYQTPPEKITTLYHGLSAGFEPVAEAGQLARVRRQYGLGDMPFILSVGTIQPRKNYQRLIQALAQLDSGYALVIVGSRGWQYETIFEEVNRLGLADRVRFPGFVIESDLPALYSAARLFVYPSLYEGFGLPALEAMACGTPVVASNRSSLPEVVGEAGLLVDPLDVTALAEAMSNVLEDEVLQQQLTAAGRRQAARFTWSRMATSLIDLYRKILAEE